MLCHPRCAAQVELAQQSSSEALQARIAELEAALLAERGATAAAEQGRAAADEELVRLRAEVGLVYWFVLWFIRVCCVLSVVTGHLLQLGVL